MFMRFTYNMRFTLGTLLMNVIEKDRNIDRGVSSEPFKFIVFKLHIIGQGLLEFI